MRGSIPLHWEQVADLTYKPKMKYLGEGKPPLEKHFRQVAESYGSVVAVDLIKQVKRREGGRGNETYTPMGVYRCRHMCMYSLNTQILN